MLSLSVNLEFTRVYGIFNFCFRRKGKMKNEEKERKQLNQKSDYIYICNNGAYGSS